MERPIFLAIIACLAGALVYDPGTTLVLLALTAATIGICGLAAIIEERLL